MRKQELWLLVADLGSCLLLVHMGCGSINPEGKRKWAGLKQTFLMREKKGYGKTEIHNIRGRGIQEISELRGDGKTL